MYENGPRCNVALCSDNAVPSASVVRNCLGPSLAQVFFKYTHRDTTSLLNLLTPPKRSKTCFSVPSDAHLDQSGIAPPTDHQVTKAFVHQNILEIGEALLEDVKKQIEESLREKVERQSREKFYLYQAKKRREAEVYAEKLHEKYQDYIETVRCELQKQLEKEWSKAAAECAKNMQKAIVQERINVVNEMMPKMRAEMSYAIQSLYREFNEIFCAQRDNIIADFNQIMRFACRETARSIVFHKLIEILMKFVQGQARATAEGNAGVSRESEQGLASSEAPVRDAKRGGCDVRSLSGTAAKQQGEAYHAQILPATGRRVLQADHPLERHGHPDEGRHR